MDSPERSRASSECFATACFAQRLVAGDESSLFDILREHGESLRRLLERRYRGLLRDDEIHDAVTTAVVQLWLHRVEAPRIKSPKAWLWIAAHNAAANIAKSSRIKARRLEVATPLSDLEQLGAPCPEDDPPAAAPTTLAQVRLDALREALEGLSGVQRRILLSGAGTPTSTRELANELHLTLATIRKHRQRGLKKLRKLLCGNEFPPASACRAMLAAERERERERATNMFCSTGVTACCL